VNDAVEPTSPRAAPLALRRMRATDVPAVMAVERASFASSWPSTSFERELSQNQMARYIVLERKGDGTANGLLGFAGLWLMLDEAHVVTVAVLPEQRGHGYGRLLVHGLVGMARDYEMHVATLECRVSNGPARALYGRYGFYEVGLRKKYYSDNQEDAVIMTTEDLSSRAYVERLARLEAELGGLLPGVSARVAEEWD
jgi:ribosomal-protein-alanine N-acetyltransferase